jgi:hypothetical protein
MSFTDQKRRIFSEEEAKAKWGGAALGLRCTLCDHKFQVGDGWRWVYANGGPGPSFGNFQVCDDCDSPDVLAMYKEACGLLFASMNEKEHGEGHWPVDIAHKLILANIRIADLESRLCEAAKNLHGEFARTA